MTITIEDIENRHYSMRNDSNEVLANVSIEAGSSDTIPFRQFKTFNKFEMENGMDLRSLFLTCIPNTSNADFGSFKVEWE